MAELMDMLWRRGHGGRFPSLRARRAAVSAGLSTMSVRRRAGRGVPVPDLLRRRFRFLLGVV